MNILSKDILPLKTSQKFSSVLEPYAGKVASTVLRRECHCEVMFLSDNIQELLFKLAKFKKNSNIFKFDDETLFDMETKKFIYNNSEIELTKNEKNFLHLLICNHGKCVNYTLIEDVVYDGEFKSLDAIRSLIKRLRKKLPKDIIFNNLDEGYFIK